MNRIVKILMNRDDLTESEAKEVVKDARRMIDDAVSEGNYEEAEDIMASELGLDMDYIFDLIL